MVTDFIYKSILFTLLILSSAACGYKTPPAPLKQSQANLTTPLSSEEVVHTIYIEKNLVISLPFNEAKNIAIIEHYLPKHCFKCEFLENYLATITASKIIDHYPSEYWNNINFNQAENTITLQGFKPEKLNFMKLKAFSPQIGTKLYNILINPEPAFTELKVKNINIDEANNKILLEWENDFFYINESRLEYFSDINYINVVFYRSDDEYPILSADASQLKAFIPLTNDSQDVYYFARFEDAFGNRSKNFILYPSDE